MKRVQLFVGSNALGLVGAAPSMAALPMIAAPASGAGYVGTESALMALSALQLLPAPLQASMAWRRAHDLGFRGYFGFALVVIAAALLVMLAPFGHIHNNTWQAAVLVLPSVAALIWLFFVPGQRGKNRFGSEQSGWNVSSGAVGRSGT